MNVDCSNTRPALARDTQTSAAGVNEVTAVRRIARAALTQGYTARSSFMVYL